MSCRDSRKSVECGSFRRASERSISAASAPVRNCWSPCFAYAKSGLKCTSQAYGSLYPSPAVVFRRTQEYEEKSPRKRDGTPCVVFLSIGRMPSPTLREIPNTVEESDPLVGPLVGFAHCFCSYHFCTIFMLRVSVFSDSNISPASCRKYAQRLLWSTNVRMAERVCFYGESLSLVVTLFLCYHNATKKTENEPRDALKVGVMYCCRPETSSTRHDQPEPSACVKLASSCH